MRSRALIDICEERPSPKDTYESVRRTLDDALAELELPLERIADADRSGPHLISLSR